MIKSIKDKPTLAVYQGILPKGFPQDAYKSARKKLAILDAAATLAETNIPPGNRLESLTGDRWGNTPSASTGNGGYASFGKKMAATTSRSQTTIK